MKSFKFICHFFCVVFASLVFYSFGSMHFQGALLIGLLVLLSSIWLLGIFLTGEKASFGLKVSLHAVMVLSFLYVGWGLVFTDLADTQTKVILSIPAAAEIFLLARLFKEKEVAS